MSRRDQDAWPTVPRAIVIGLDCPTGLQTARILARRGVPVVGVAGDRRHPCARTNACERVLASDTSGPALIESLLHVGGTLGARAVLVPCTDMSVLLISRHRAELSSCFHVVLPDAETVETLVDKAAFQAYAERTGLPVPRTVLLRERGDVDAAADALRFPVILKPTVKTPAWVQHTAAKAYRVESVAELRRLQAQCASWTPTLVAQEWIAGVDADHYTCNAYFGAGGEALVTLTTRKLRQWPTTGGQACLSVEADDATVRATTLALFGAIGHRGLAYLEMKRDARTGAYLIIEPNVGRPTGRSATAEAAGVELLLTMYRDVLGEPLPVQRVQAFRGTKWVHLRRDVQAAVHHWRRGELTAREWAASWRGPMVEALHSWRDPVPFWADLSRAGATALGLRRRGPRPSERPGDVAAAPASA